MPKHDAEYPKHAFLADVSTGVNPIWPGREPDPLIATSSVIQQALADGMGTHVTQIRRYEAGTATPTLDVLRNLAIGLSTTIDHLAFDPHEREPADNLKLAFEATQHLTPEEQAVVLQLIEAMLLKHEARRWAS